MAKQTLEYNIISVCSEKKNNSDFYYPNDKKIALATCSSKREKIFLNGKTIVASLVSDVPLSSNAVHFEQICSFSKTNIKQKEKGYVTFTLTVLPFICYQLIKFTLGHSMGLELLLVHLKWHNKISAHFRRDGIATFCISSLNYYRLRCILL